ncbi:phage terminase small subunit P27 family [Halomonas sp. ISL-60]|uniref:phage terminase small subunit P27 family n=1 Tax=Halomonas sp. ISL-56 TaxID=2819149 RepID=UPI001BEBA625|nr:phage terminase small subunit P27 family [Halomonas sp. ISL-56]MBT2771323.1 phage terminase small subunit P27 family [Halomonas sp. ISL-60]MBT2800680.1 phage terminase small subunit P27 family [Halomonas sp. ISL-56]
MAGRRPKPTDVKRAAGNPGGRPLNENEIESDVIQNFEPPSHLSERAKEAWLRIVEHYSHTKVVQITDEIALESLCEVYADIRELREEIAINGRTFISTDRTGSTLIKRNPAVAELSDADKRLRAWLVEFGLTPSSRSKFNTDGSAKGDEDPLDEFL